MRFTKTLIIYGGSDKAMASGHEDNAAIFFAHTPDAQVHVQSACDHGAGAWHQVGTVGEEPTGVT